MFSEIFPSSSYLVQYQVRIINPSYNVSVNKLIFLLIAFSWLIFSLISFILVQTHLLLGKPRKLLSKESVLYLPSRKMFECEVTANACFQVYESMTSFKREKSGRSRPAPQPVFYVPCFLSLLNPNDF